MIRLLTIKPERDEIEYGVWLDDKWLIHGVVMPAQMSGATTLGDLKALAAQHAVAEGYLLAPLE